MITLQEDDGLGYVWLVWGLTNDDSLELIAIATTEEDRDRYMIDRSGRYKRIAHERTFVNHAYGQGMLGMYLKSRRRPNG